MMKQILTTIQEKTNKILLLAILAGAITSCDSVLNYNEDCDIEYCVKFKYDYNMEEKDVFAEQVRTVTLYAFDDNNNLVYQKTDEGEPLSEGDYAMNVIGIDPSQYRLVVWAGLNDESFAVPLLYPNQAKIDELTVKTLRKQAPRSTSEDEKDQYIVDNSLYSLWHGEVKKRTDHPQWKAANHQCVISEKHQYYPCYCRTSQSIQWTNNKSIDRRNFPMCNIR